MSRRLLPTLADYVVVAINPALVMTLVGSLVYFLLELLYQGNYPDRLQFSLTMFVFAIVLISRIAMENGFEHAAPFGIALAIVVGLAMQRFIDYGHGPLAHFGWLVNWGLMALSWWCAHQLTWDCTVIDESHETEGQGLLETVGIDRASGEVRAVEQVTAKETSAASATGDEQRTARAKGNRFRWEEILNRQARPHAPGVWVVYFSLAALPIFGIGQAFIPASNAASRRYVFVLFVVYVASGLGLLLTTSFLALRRYLRQRKLEMPTRMVATWLTTGVLMIVALLAIVALLPRPNAEFAVSQIPWPRSAGADSEGQSDEADKSNETETPKSSPHSIGREGTRDPQASSGGGADHSRDERPNGSKADQNSQGGQGAQPGLQADAAGQQQDRAGDKGDPPSPKNDQSSSGGQAGEQGQQSANGGKESSSEKGGGSGEQKSDGAGQQKSPDGKPGGQSAQSQQSSQSQPPASSPPSSPPLAPASSPMSLGFLGDLLKWIFYGGVLLAGGYFAWIYREQVLAFLQHWLQQLREFWDQLRGRSRKPVASGATAPVAVAPPLRSFSEFADPFAAGKPRGWTNAALVKYTFAALEAWSRDRGYDRRPEETPHEFARQVGSQTPALASDARALVDEYGRIVYGSGASPQFNIEQLRRLWKTLHSLPAPLPAQATAAASAADWR